VKALVLTTSYPVAPGLVSGGFVRDLLEGLTASGAEFEVVTPAIADATEANAGHAAIRVHAASYAGNAWRGGLAHRRGLPETLAAEPWKWLLVPGLVRAMEAVAARRIAHARRRGRPFDLLWSHWLFPAGWLGAGLARAHHLPHLVTAHGGDVHRLERLARVPGVSAALARVWANATVCAPAEATALRVERVLSRRVLACPLPANLGAMTDAPRGVRPRGERGAPRLLYLGRFEPIKAPDRLLDACAQVPAGRLGAVKLAGAGSLERELRARARGVDHPVTFVGVLEKDAKHAALIAADLMVLPSRRLRGGRGEGLPHAGMEALAAGTPVIAPRGSALGDLVERTGAGMTFDGEGSEPECAARLARLLEALAASPRRITELAARARMAGAAFAPRECVPRWSALLASAAGGGR